MLMGYNKSIRNSKWNGDELSSHYVSHPFSSSETTYKYGLKIIFSIGANICDKEIAINYNTNTITIAIAKIPAFPKPLPIQLCSS